MALNSQSKAPFDSPLANYLRILDPQQKALKKLGIVTVRDLLYYFPVKYGDTSEMKTIDSLSKGDTAVIFGKISKLKTSKAFRKRIPMSDGVITDETGSIKSVWFHQPYLAKMIHEDAFIRAEGKVSERKGELYLSNPKIEVVQKVPLAVGSSLFGKTGEGHVLYPVYKESRGVTSNWMYHAIQKIFKTGVLDELIDPIPEEILLKYHLPKLRNALIWIHAPKKR